MGAVARGPACSTGCYSPRGVLSCLRSEFLASGDTTRRRPSTPGEGCKGNTGEYLCVEPQGLTEDLFTSFFLYTSASSEETPPHPAETSRRSWLPSELRPMATSSESSWSSSPERTSPR